MKPIQMFFPFLNNPLVFFLSAFCRIIPNGLLFFFDSF